MFQRLCLAGFTLAICVGMGVSGEYYAKITKFEDGQGA